MHQVILVFPPWTFPSCPGGTENARLGKARVSLPGEQWLGLSGEAWACRLHSGVQDFYVTGHRRITSVSLANETPGQCQSTLGSRKTVRDHEGSVCSSSRAVWFTGKYPWLCTHEQTALCWAQWPTYSFLRHFTGFAHLPVDYFTSPFRIAACVDIITLIWAHTGLTQQNVFSHPV